MAAALGKALSRWTIGSAGEEPKEPVVEAGLPGEQAGRFSILGSVKEAATGAQNKVNGVIAAVKKIPAVESFSETVSDFLPENFEELGITGVLQRGVREKVDRAKLGFPPGDIRWKLLDLERKGEIDPLCHKITDAEVKCVAECKRWVDGCCFENRGQMFSTEDFEIDCLVQIGLLASYEPIGLVNSPDFSPAEIICLGWVVDKCARADETFHTVFNRNNQQPSTKKYHNVIETSLTKMREHNLTPVETRKGFDLDRSIEIQKMINDCFESHCLDVAEVVMEVCGSKSEKEIGHHFTKILKQSLSSAEQEHKEEDGSDLT